MQDSTLLWHPSEEDRARSAMSRFAESVGIDGPLDADRYRRLHDWSISDLGGFWSAFWDFAGIIGEKGDRAVELRDDARMSGARFFPKAKLNIAENLLRGGGPETAIVETDETGAAREISRDALRAEVARVARGLRDAGVVPGDRVAVVLPNRLECLVTHLAALSVGAVWTSCSPDFGAAAILDRIGQVTPKVMFVQPRIRYGGKDIDIAARLGEVAGQIQGLGALVVVGAGDVAAPGIAVPWAAFGTPGPLVFEALPFDAPSYILYSSGTTGRPKAIVHRTGGVLLNQVKEHLLHGDVRPGDRFMWYTNTAWMMYHWSAAALACDAVVGLYDGAPILKTEDGLDCGPLWRAVETHRLTHLGISPKYLSTVEEAGLAPGRAHDLASLRWLLSAGSPVPPAQFDWIYDAVKRDMGYASISGGTEIVGCFLLGSPVHPVRRGALTARGLGLAVNVLDDRGAPVVGRPGDLVCTEPFPSMPLTFWGGDGDARYRDTYFAQRPEIWTHGDLAENLPGGSAIIHGRSDTTLNPGGVRIGTADIYNVCERFAEIEDCVVFGRPVEGDEEIVLCVQMRDGTLDADLAGKLRRAIREACSPRHVPAVIYAVSGVPYTINGKRVETAARAAATGSTIKNEASIANADCLADYRAIASRTAH